MWCVAELDEDYTHHPRSLTGLYGAGSPEVGVATRCPSADGLLGGTWSGVSASAIVLASRGAGSIIVAMSRLRRLVLSDRFFFISCRVLPRRALLSEGIFPVWHR